MPEKKNVSLGKTGKKKGVIRPKCFPAMFRDSSEPSTDQTENLLPLIPCQATPAAIVLPRGFLTLHRDLQAPKHGEINLKNLKKAANADGALSLFQGGRPGRTFKSSKTAARGADSAVCWAGAVPSLNFAH